MLLIQHKRYASSVVMATFCLEQLGRLDIYREKAKDVEAGKIVTLETMKRELREHLPKLFKAQIPVTVSITGLGERPEPGSKAERQLAEQFATLRKYEENRAPHRALDIRMRALHVDRVRQAPGWNRPSHEIKRDDADSWVSAADVRYSLLRSELKKSASNIDKAIWAAAERLQVPDAPWDIWTWEVEQPIQTVAVSAN